VWFSVPWSLELYQQANTRLYRQGQTQTVRVYHIVTQGTIDEDVVQAVEGKALTQDRLLEALKYRLEAVE
jgi:SNF2 family DNA or RNA helicase